MRHQPVFYYLCLQKTKMATFLETLLILNIFKIIKKIFFKNQKLFHKGKKVKKNSK